MKELTVLLQTRLRYLKKRKVRTESDSIVLDLRNDHISFRYYRDINFVQENFQIICKVRVIVIIVVESQEVG